MIQDSDNIASQKVVDHIRFRDELHKEFDKQLEREIMTHTLPTVWYFNYMIVKRGGGEVEFRQLKISLAIKKKDQFEYVLESLFKELDTFDIYFSFEKLGQKLETTVETALI